MKKSSLIALALAATLILGGGGVYAAGQIARSNAISEENARSFAYVDAGILPEEAEYVRTKFDFSRGRFVYEIEFIAQGMHYEYTLDSVTGAVMEKEIETAQNAVARYTEPASAQTLPQPETLPAQPTQAAAAAQILTSEEAKQLVLAHLKLDESSARILEAKLDREDGQQLYEIKVKDPAGSTHEYKLHAVNGSIVKEVHKIAAAVVPGSRAAESSAAEATLPTQPAAQESSQPAAPTVPSEAKTSAAPSPTTHTPGTAPQPTWPAATQPESTAQAAQPTRPAATQPVATQPAATQPPATRPAATQPQSTAQAAQPTRPAATQPVATQPAATQPAQPQAIGVEAAKAIALKDAGQTAAAVVFTKARQEKEDGRLIYDIEFYVSGQMEYEYEIDAYSGAILEKDVEATEALKAAQRASAEASRQAAAEASRQAAAEASRQAAEAARKTAEEAARKSSEEAARQAAAEASRQAAEAARKASEEASRKAAEEASRKAAAEAARQAAAASSTAATQPQVISVDKAKEIALKDAGLAVSQVQFEKAKLEREDGRLVYEIEFFIRGQKEYGYEIDAYTGRILEKDVEDWDD